MKPLAIYDSGLGGVNVLKYLKEFNPNIDYLFFGDYLNCPYGDKNKEELTSIIDKNINYISSFNVTGVAIACNTAVSNSYKRLINKYRLPLYELITPTCIQALNISTNSRIGLIATSNTINSKEYEKTINSLDCKASLFSLPTPKLVTLIEANQINTSRTKEILKDYLSYFNNLNIDTLILGCTHYDLLIPLIKELTNINIVSSSYSFASYLINNVKDLSTSRNQKYYVSNNLTKFNLLASNILKEDIKGKLYTYE